MNMNMLVVWYIQTCLPAVYKGIVPGVIFWGWTPFSVTTRWDWPTTTPDTHSNTLLAMMCDKQIPTGWRNNSPLSPKNETAWSTNNEIQWIWNYRTGFEDFLECQTYQLRRTWTTGTLLGCQKLQLLTIFTTPESFYFPCCGAYVQKRPKVYSRVLPAFSGIFSSNSPIELQLVTTEKKLWTEDK